MRHLHRRSIRCYYALITVLGRALSTSYAPLRPASACAVSVVGLHGHVPHLQLSSDAQARVVNVLSVDFHPLPEVGPVIINILSRISLSLVQRTSSCRFCRPYSRYLVSLVQVRHICQEFSDLFQEASRSHFCRRSNYRVYRDIWGSWRFYFFKFCDVDCLAILPVVGYPAAQTVAFLLVGVNPLVERCLPSVDEFLAVRCRSVHLSFGVSFLSLG